MAEGNGAGIVQQGQKQICGFVLKFDDLSEIEVWSEKEETKGGLNMVRTLEEVSVRGITVPGHVQRVRFQLACEGIAKKSEMRTTSHVPLLELRRVAEAAGKLQETEDRLRSAPVVTPELALQHGAAHDLLEDALVDLGVK